MRALTLWTLTAVAIVGLSGCHRAESPEKVRSDVVKATDAAAEKDSEASEKLASADAAASKDVANAEAQADRKTTEATADAIVTQAEGDHEVALAQCESLSGQAQKDCKRQADDKLELAKARVKQLKKDAG